MLEAPNLWELVGKRAEATPDSRMVVDERGDSLTFAEFEAAAEVAAAGLAAKGIGEGTVKTHVSSVLAKLGVQSRTQAALHAVRMGIVSAGELPAR